MRATREPHAGETSLLEAPLALSFTVPQKGASPREFVLPGLGCWNCSPKLNFSFFFFFFNPGSPSCTLRSPHLQSITLPSQVLTRLNTAAGFFTSGILQSLHLRTCWWKTRSCAGWGKREFPLLPRWKRRSAKISIQVALGTRVS